MEVLASVLFATFSHPYLLLILVVGETGLRLAALALRWEGCAWSTRSAFLGYHIGHTGHSSSSGGGGVFDQDELLLPECLDRLAVLVYQRGGKGPNAAVVDCAFCLSRIEEVHELQCHHVFHRGCLDSWLLRPCTTCPLCCNRLLPSEPPHACATVDDMYPHDYDLDDLSSPSPSSSSSSTVHAGATLWHT